LQKVGLGRNQAVKILRQASHPSFDRLTWIGGLISSLRPYPFRRKDKSAIGTKVVKDPLGNFLVVKPRARYLQDRHIGSSSHPRITYLAMFFCLMERRRPSIVILPVVLSLSFLPFLTSKKSLAARPLLSKVHLLVKCSESVPT
jgi:hypothetical protein